MPISEIKELKILPALAIGRFGSSSEPLDNYEVVEDPENLTNLRKIQPAETFAVDQQSGEITGVFVPEGEIKFRDENGKIRPVAPFFEVWARFDADDFLQPLTLQHLSELNLTASDVKWKVKASNHKAFRRTGDRRDRIDTDLAVFSDHAVKNLRGTAANFKAGKSISFGSVRYIKPTQIFPEIKIRFSPPKGNVYGINNGDPNIVDDVYNAAQGRWDGHRDNITGIPIPTRPGFIFARNGPNGLGYLDDSCDGIIEFSLGNLSALARFSSGPPAFAPDSFPIRTVTDELEQMLLGAEVTEDITVKEISDIIRRAVDTVWHLNTDFMNRSGMASHDTGFERAGEPIFQPVGRAVYPAVLKLHTDVLKNLQGLKQTPETQEFKDGVFALRRLLEMIRASENVGDLSNAGRRKMPSMMRGSDGLHLALTKRQVNKLRRALQQFNPSTGQTNLPEQNLIDFIKKNASFSFLHTGISTGNGQQLSQLFADPAAVLAYLKVGVAQGDIMQGNPLVVPGKPDESAFVAIISNEDHPMNGPFSTVDPTTNKTGITIVREWISSLT